MKFDSVITILFIIAFFILPSILKQVQARKKKTPAAKPSRKKPGAFGKIGDQIRQFILELEAQARQQKEAGSGEKQERPGDIWETLAEGEPVLSGGETDGTALSTLNVPPRVMHKETVPEKITLPGKRRAPLKKAGAPGTRFRRGRKACRLKTIPLQNAIVWSEILSKPLALRDKQNS